MSNWHPMSETPEKPKPFGEYICWYVAKRSKAGRYGFCYRVNQGTAWSPAKNFPPDLWDMKEWCELPERGKR